MINTITLVTICHHIWLHFFLVIFVLPNLFFFLIVLKKYNFLKITIVSLISSHSGDTFEEGNGNSPQYSCLENRMDRGGW